jgi:hypothetical protein
MRGACRVLVGKTEVKRQLGRPTCRWRIIFKVIFKRQNEVWTGFI